MSPLARAREWLSEHDLVLTVLAVLAVVGLGVLTGYQYLMPDKRVLGVAAAVVLLGVAWRLDVLSGIGVILIALPFPRYTVFGSTNLAFILLLGIAWLLRITQREAYPPRRTPIDAPLGLLVLAYVLSFYNVDSAEHLGKALIITSTFLATVILYYLITSNVRSEAGLRRLHVFLAISIGIIYLFCLWEMIFPGHELIPGWIDLRDAKIELQAADRAIRIGGPWLDYELLSEFVALNLIFFVFLMAQARSTSRRVLFGVLALTSVLIEFATVTRGGSAALVVGLLYLAYLVRRRLNIVPVIIFGVLISITVAAMYVALRKYTAIGDLLTRFSDTQIVNGMPDSRAETWPQAWERWMLHPFVGNGPYYSAERGIRLWYWPHNLPLFIGNCFGFLGFGAYAWMIVNLWRACRPQTDQLGHSDYVAAYMIALRVQLAIFIVDEMKIEYLRNPNYQYQVWVLFAMIATAWGIARGAGVPEPARFRSPTFAAATPSRS